MSSHVRFTLGLYRHSGRGLAPMIVLVFWFLFAIANNPPSLDALSALFPAFVVVGPWIAISVGNVDDRNHREMATAAVGSRGRLHRSRALTSFILCAAIAVVGAAYLATVLDERAVSRPQVFVVCLAVLIGASALGIAYGSWLHQPLVSSRTIAVVAGLGLPTATLLLPPIQNAIRELGAANLTPGFVLGGACVAVAALLIGAAGETTNRAPR